MSAQAFVLVLVAAFTHAYWNLLLKRAGGTQAFVALSKAAEVVLFAPLFLVLLPRDAAAGAPFFVFVAVGAALTLLNYIMLGQAYSRADLGLVYPVSRGAILLFLPVLGYLTLGERLQPMGVAAVVLILLGIVTMQLPALTRAAVRDLVPQIARSSGTLFALLAALAAAGYTLWDKRAVQRYSTFLYFYSYTVVVAVAYCAFVFTRMRREVHHELRVHKAAILQVGALNTATYLLVLVALRQDVSTYVVALRQLSIVFGALMSVYVLAEELGAPRRAGVALIVCGCVLLALTRS